MEARAVLVETKACTGACAGNDVAYRSAWVAISAISRHRMRILNIVYHTSDVLQAESARAIMVKHRGPAGQGKCQQPAKEIPAAWLSHGIRTDRTGKSGTDNLGGILR